MIQNLVISRGEPFQEKFYLKKPDGSASSGRGSRFSIVIFRKDYVREYPLRNKGSYLELNLTSRQTSDLDSNTLSYKIVVHKEPEEVIALGLLRVQ